MAGKGSMLSPVARSLLRHPTGRSQGEGFTVAVFGSTGFLGRYVCAELGHTGNRALLPYRGELREAQHLKPQFDLGYTGFMPWNGRDRDSIRYALKGADVVVNLVGKHYETKHMLPWWINYTMDDVHVDIARNIAEVAAEEGVPRFIHVSSVLASPESPSVWAASKFRGEKAVRRAFPSANIVRLGQVYGPEDRFLNWYGDRMVQGLVPLVENGDALLQPVSYADVARGLYALTQDVSINGETFEFVGDEEYTQKETVDFVFDVTNQDAKIINLPLNLAENFGKFCEYFPDPKLTADWALQLSLDQVKSGMFPGLKELDVTPVKMEFDAPNFLVKFNRGGHFQKAAGPE